MILLPGDGSQLPALICACCWVAPPPRPLRKSPKWGRKAYRNSLPHPSAQIITRVTLVPFFCQFSYPYSPSQKSITNYVQLDIHALLWDVHVRLKECGLPKGKTWVPCLWLPVNLKIMWYSLSVFPSGQVHFTREKTLCNSRHSNRYDGTIIVTEVKQQLSEIIWFLWGQGDYS